MAESIYAKNLESLGRMIAHELTLDLVRLDPPADLKPDALQTLRTEGTALHTETGNKKGDWRTATLDRTTDADQLATKASQAVALLESRDASADTIEDARYYVRKMRGKRKGKKPVDDPSTPDVDESEKAISISQQSNAGRISTFNELIDFLDAQPEYAGITNDGFKIADLRGFVDSVQAKHDVSIAAAAGLSNARIGRGKVFFDNKDSIINRAKRLKKLVGGVYGFDSPEYETMNGFPFSRR